MADVRLRDLNPAEFNYGVNVAGNLGVGTTSPDHSLEIDGGSSTDVLHLNSTAPILKVTATNNSSGLRINTVGQSSGQLLRVQKDGTTRFQINHDGDVGIGTASPDVKLHVYDATINSLDLLHLETAADSVDDYIGIKFTSGVGGSGPHAAIRVYGGPASGDSYISLLTTSDGGTLTQGLTQIHNGNVGIGTTSPANLLHVLGNSANGEIKAERSSGAVSLIQAQASLVRFGATSNHDLHLISNDDTKVTIKTSGNVGIGTTNPGRLLELSADTNGTVNLFRLKNSDTLYSQSVDFSLDTNKDLVIEGASGSGGIHFNMGSRGYFFSNGKVGIGTTSPEETLHVNGNVKITGSIDVGSSGFNVSSGFILPFGGGTAPSGWLECNGQVVSRSTYSALFAIIGTTYGAGDGSTTFAVPDLQGRVIVGQGGSTALRTPTDLENVGDTFGSQTHTLTVDELPSHTHKYDYIRSRRGSPHVHMNHAGDSKLDRIDTTATGGDQAHNNIQPSIVINYLIKT